jgi:ADP-heptose:LPS heptosyltransferase
MGNAQLFIGQEGGLNHIAAAVKTKGIVVMGGILPSGIVSYRNHIHLTSKPECSPCWLREKCPYDKKCMSAITPEMVVKIIEENL